MKNDCASHLLRCAQLANEAGCSLYLGVLSRGLLRDALHMGLLVTFFLHPSGLLRTAFRAQA